MALSNGGYLHFTAGSNYAIGTAVEGTSNNLKVRGNGATITMLAATNDANTVYIYGADIANRLTGVEVYDLTIDANYAAAGGYQKRGLRIEYCDSPIVQNVTVDEAFVNLHFGTGVLNPVADTCTCAEFDNDGFDSGGTAAVEAEEPTGVTFRNCSASSTNPAKDNAWEIEDGTVNTGLEDCTTDGDVHVRNHEGDNAKTDGVTFTRVTAGTFTIQNLYNTATNYVKNVTFVDCAGPITTYGPIEGLSLQSTTNPIPTLTSAAGVTVTEAFTVTITFNWDVTGFAVGDITVGNGTLSDFTAVSASVYTVQVTPVASGTVSVGVAADVCSDGDSTANLSGNTLQRTAAV